MKALIVVILCGVAIFGVVKVLGSTLSPAEYDGDATGHRGDLEVDKVSRAKMQAVVWAEPRKTRTREDRREMMLGTIEPGETFMVLKHVQRGGPLWIQISCMERDLEGWIASTADEPFMAERLDRR